MIKEGDHVVVLARQDAVHPVERLLQRRVDKTNATSNKLAFQTGNARQFGRHSHARFGRCHDPLCWWPIMMVPKIISAYWASLITIFMGLVFFLTSRRAAGGLALDIGKASSSSVSVGLLLV